MAKEPHLHELITLKTIAEKLNQMNELQPLLGEVLESLLALTGLTTGWIYVESGPRQFRLAADRRLPQALSLDDKLPMQGNYCWCLKRYAADELPGAVNILSCKRIEMAIRDSTGDTEGITHHATVPLRAGSRQFGVLNVAAPGKTRFDDEELALLESVAYQIGSAVERVQLYEAERRRSAHFAQLGELGRAIAAAEGGALRDAARDADRGGTRNALRMAVRRHDRPGRS
ncbi:GAF domain-containing protein [Cohnella ginsengisoli]|uniref:GAF domain-containing protein n=1 Tax=Cohnella ginsengisoli TaxID=425004 RepID=A0A9X4KN32_9BACL|nr:GAF domain-containing protein [Cohnella ginsengisoli]MDG0792600.1 GAF domain-containing protein [Cohnella ginsengisoli]